MAVNIAPALYGLLPPEDIRAEDRGEWIKSAADRLLRESHFLRGGLDENVRSSCLFLSFYLNCSTVKGKTKYFAHPALKEVLVDFFYTGNHRIADKRPDLFRRSIPVPCLALVAAVVIFCSFSSVRACID